jgi:hypothetical protein
VFEKELEHNEDSLKIRGISEYGYGMWTRWSRTGPVTLFSKADWHTLARLTVNRKHGDAGHKDRTLAIWVGRGYYHCTTYTVGNPNVIQNINYKD